MDCWGGGGGGEVKHFLFFLLLLFPLLLLLPLLLRLLLLVLLRLLLLVLLLVSSLHGILSIYLTLCTVTHHWPVEEVGHRGELPLELPRVPPGYIYLWEINFILEGGREGAPRAWRSPGPRHIRWGRVGGGARYLSEWL